MKYLGAIQNAKDIITKDFMDGALVEKISKIENEEGTLTGRVPLIAADGSLTASAYTLGVGQSGVLGMVQGSDGNNEVQILADGKMEVNSISVSRLVQDEELTLLCGNSKNQ